MKGNTNSRQPEPKQYPWDTEPPPPATNEELFGPAANIYQLFNEGEANDLTNDSPCGLEGSVHSHDIEQIRQIAERIAIRVVFMNQQTGATKR